MLRDYLTDLFPILELGTSAKMLSIVPLLAGGGLYETGAGGSAPKHVQQFLKENLPALGFARRVSWRWRYRSRTSGSKTGNAKALRRSRGARRRHGQVLENEKSPTRKVGGLDNRGSHFYLALYWAEALATQTKDAALAAKFKAPAAALADKEQQIVAELNGVQGKPVDIGGYYHPDPVATTKAMRPSATLNAIVDGLG